MGRVKLPIAPHAAPAPFEGGSFALTRHALALMERVAACVRVDEPVLLVGETGTGKTTVVQQLAQQMGHTLVVHNLNQQSDSSELLGGFRPVALRQVFTPLVARFESLFCRTFSRAKNAPFLEKLGLRLAKGEWPKLLTLMRNAAKTLQQSQARAAPYPKPQPQPQPQPQPEP